MNILGIDYSLNGSSMIFGDLDGIKDYRFFSKLKSDIKNPKCVEILEEYNGEQKLDNMICYFLSKINTIDLVVLESASFNSNNSSSDFKAGYHIIKYLCRRLDVKCLEVPPISNKLFFTEDAKADKNKMVNTAINKYSKEIDFNSISKKHREDIADSLSLYELGQKYLKCKRLPAPKGCVDTADIKYFETLPLHQQQVIAKLYNRDDLYKEIVKKRNKLKK